MKENKECEHARSSDDLNRPVLILIVSTKLPINHNNVYGYNIITMV